MCLSLAISASTDIATYNVYSDPPKQGNIYSYPPSNKAMSKHLYKRIREVCESGDSVGMKWKFVAFIDETMRANRVFRQRG
uniref:Uncharacterized protein n=1 Tax=Noccaea caerulescens TaxID=107243 RepID=A0A1J3G055_NOCCA